MNKRRGSHHTQNTIPNTSTSNWNPITTTVVQPRPEETRPTRVRRFDKNRLLPKNQGLVFVDTKRSSEKRFQKFEQDWNNTLQVMRSIASRVSAPGAKPDWIDASVAPGAACTRLQRVPMARCPQCARPLRCELQGNTVL